jgi:hypothetical protein
VQSFVPFWKGQAEICAVSERILSRADPVRFIFKKTTLMNLAR